MMPKVEDSNITTISVIVPFYKELDLISDAIVSVANQKIPSDYRLEVVICNDGIISSQDILTTIQSRTNHAVRIITNRGEHGAGNARNVAIDYSTGSIIAFLDADDIWLEGKIEQQISLINQGYNFTATGYRISRKKYSISPPEKIDSSLNFFLNSSIGTSTIMLKKSILGTERFSNLPRSQDTELWARLAGKKDFKYSKVLAPYVIYRPSSRTSNKIREFLNYRSVVKMFNFSTSDRCLIYLKYFIRGAINHYLSR